MTWTHHLEYSEEFAYKPAELIQDVSTVAGYKASTQNEYIVYKNTLYREISKWTLGKKEIKSFRITCETWNKDKYNENIKDLYAKHYKSLVREIKDLYKWKDNILSLDSKPNIVKMLMLHEAICGLKVIPNQILAGF